MASGWKEGPPPGRLYVVKTAYEIRYYTTPETFAAAIIDYGMETGVELAVYSRCEAPVLEDFKDLITQNPMPTPLQYPQPAPLINLPQHMSTANQAVWEANKKAMAVWRRRIKNLLLPILSRY